MPRSPPLRGSERLSERLSANSERLSNTPSEPLLPKLPAMAPDELVLPEPTLPSACRRQRRVSNEKPEESTIAPLDDVLAQRDAAATVLTGGPERVGLPALPLHLARDILDVAAPIAPSLGDFANTAKVDLALCVGSESIDVSRRALVPAHADVVAWLMRRGLRASLVWGSTAVTHAELQTLDASGNPIGPRGAAAIGRALSSAPSLRSLRLNGCRLCSDGGTDTSGLVVLAQGLCSHRGLYSVHLSQNEIGTASSPNVGMRALVAALCAAEAAYATVDLSGNDLGHAGAELLARLLASQPSLTELRAAANQLTGPWGKQSKGLRVLASAVAESTTLRALDLSSNAIGSRDSMDFWSGTKPSCCALFLVEALRINSSLTSLTLTSNALVGEQAERLRKTWATRGTAPDALRL